LLLEADVVLSGCVQVIEILWNLFDLAAETANQVAAGSSSHSAQHQPHAQMQEQQEQASGAGTLQDESGQEQPLQALQKGALSTASPVAQQLVDVLAVSLQQQVATCSSLQVRQWRLAQVAQSDFVHAGAHHPPFASCHASLPDQRPPTASNMQHIVCTAKKCNWWSESQLQLPQLNTCACVRCSLAEAAAAQ
jgi:hypothetical protein